MEEIYASLIGSVMIVSIKSIEKRRDSEFRREEGRYASWHFFEYLIYQILGTTAGSNWGVKPMGGVEPPTV